MCGIVGVKQPDGSTFPVLAFSKLMEQASIRGVHATGVSYSLDCRLVTRKEPVPWDRFELPQAQMVLSTGAIGHLRYSTSDLDYNQPNHVGGLSLVHNGVVSQADPSTWEELFGVQCETRNDSEILARMMLDGRHPLTLVDSSQACIAIDDKGTIRFWRNEYRPLYFSFFAGALVVASTSDIIRRALPLTEVVRCDPCVEYTWDGKLLTSVQIREPMEDMQP